MSTYPRLSEMGVANPQQIAEFAVNSIGYTDYLRITYDRPKGSFLPVSRTYNFPRVQKTAKAESGKEAVVMESSPHFREAVKELQGIVDAGQDCRDTVASMRTEIQHLEETLALHCANMKALIDAAEQD